MLTRALSAAGRNCALMTSGVRYQNGQGDLAHFPPSVLLMGEVVSDSLATFAANLLGIRHVHWSIFLGGWVFQTGFLTTMEEEIIGVIFVLNN